MKPERKSFLDTERGWATSILVGLLVFGFYGVFIKKNPEISPFTFLFFFQVMGLITWGVGYWTTSKDRGRGLSRSEKVYLFFFAVAAVGNDLTFFYAMKMTTIANAVLAHQMVSLVMVFFAPLLLGERTRKREVIALLISLVGLVAIYLGADKTQGGFHNVLGITLGLVSAVFLAFLIILYKLLKMGGMSLHKMNTYRYFWSVLLLLPLAPIQQFDFGLRGEHAAVVVILFGFLFAYVASGIHNWGISHARGLVSTILGKMEPVIASAYAFLILGETVPASTLIGGVIIVGSSIWLAFGEARGKGEMSEH